MTPPARILLVEDEAVLALQLRTLLEAEGYAVVGPARSGPQALALAAAQPVDLALCDIHLQGPWDGIETAARLRARRPLPIVYLTALADADTVARALPTDPAAYLAKPATPGGLRAALALALHRLAQAEAPAAPPEPPASAREVLLRRNDDVFIKHLGQFVRVPLADLLLLAADNTVTTVVTAARKYVLRLPLSTVLARLHAPDLLRVHRSYALSMRHVTAFADNTATVGGHAVPIGRQYRSEFLRQFTAR